MGCYNCRMCGAPLPVTVEPIVECEYCGSRQPVPSADSEKKQTLFARANRLRLACEFDRAAAVYESIAAEFPEEAEASWGIVLCRYGIEYVDDPATGKKVPTCHRSSFASVLEDADYQQTLDNADPLTRRLYHREAAHIEELREGILSVSASEKPYDIFICYKETDERGSRTLDSVLAQDLYDLLTGKGYRVFFSRISLEDKLGREYEPYIFAALNSAKVMLAVGTCFEHYDAVWVKNEWSRFLKLMEQDSEKYLIPCYKDIDAYDMPKEFRKLQAQDLGKVGAHQDLLRGLEKLMKSHAQKKPEILDLTRESLRLLEKEKEAKQVENDLSLGILAYKSGDVKKARNYIESVLRLDANCIGAYLWLLRMVRGDAAVPYVKKVASFQTDLVIDYINNHRDVIGNPKDETNLLTTFCEHQGTSELILRLLKMGITGKTRKAFLNFLDKQKDIRIVEAFIKNGADVNATIQWTKNYKEKLLSGESDPSVSYDIIHCSALATAIAARQSINVIRLLLDAGADVNFIVTKYSYYRAYKSQSSGHKRKECSYSILNQAVRAKDYELVQLLLDKGADPNSSRITYKRYNKLTTDLATFYSNLEETIWNTKDRKMLEILLQNKADPNRSYEQNIGRNGNLIGHSKRTSLAAAILYSDDLEMVKLLLKYGARPNTQYWYQDQESDAIAIMPTLGLAIQKRRRDAVCALFDAGASFNDYVEYNKYDSADRFPLRELCFSSAVESDMGEFIRGLGWKGSKAGLFRKAHICNYSW